MLILYFLNLLVIINSILITKSLYINHKPSDKILIGFTIYLAQIILFILLLGIPGILTLSNLVILTVFFSLIVLLVFKHKKNAPFFPHPHFIREALIWVAQHRLLAISISVLLGFSLVKIFQNLINPPFLWSSIIYHFPFPVEWIKNANLTNPIVVFYDAFLSYAAMNGEFLFFWLMVALKNVFIADIAIYPFYIMGALACFGIMRRLGASKEISLLSGILFSLTPQYFKHLLFNGNDVMVASLFLIALNFILLLKKDFSLKNVAISAVVVGLLLGVKSYAVMWAPLLLPLVIYFVVKNYRSTGVSNFILLGASFIALVLLFGGFTYIRNFIQTGNPLYPVNYEFFGIELKGPLEYPYIQSSASLLNINLEEMLFHQSFGLSFVFLAFPALFLSLPILFIKSKFRLSFDIIYLLALPLIMILVFYTQAPYQPPRCAFPIIGLATLMGIYTLGKFKLSTKVMRMIIFALIIAATAELTGHMMLVYSLLLSTLVFIGFALAKKRDMWKLHKRFGAFLFFIFLISLIPLEKYYEAAKYKNYVEAFHWEKDLTRTWIWVYEETLHNPKNIAYVGSSAIFPLYGKDFKNNVYYVSVNKKEPCLTNFSKYYHYAGSFQRWIDRMRRDGCMREKTNFNTWLKNLYQKDTDLLFITCTDDFKLFFIEDEWAKEHRDIFRPVLSNKRVHIYEILRKE